MFGFKRILSIFKWADSRDFSRDFSRDLISGQQEQHVAHRLSDDPSIPDGENEARTVEKVSADTSTMEVVPDDRLNAGSGNPGSGPSKVYPHSEKPLDRVSGEQLGKDSELISEAEAESVNNTNPKDKSNDKNGTSDKGKDSVVQSGFVVNHSKLNLPSPDQSLNTGFIPQVTTEDKDESRHLESLFEDVDAHVEPSGFDR